MNQSRPPMDNDQTLGQKLYRRAKQIIPGGDHDIVMAEVIDGELVQDIDSLTMKDTSWHYGG